MFSDLVSRALVDICHLVKGGRIRRSADASSYSRRGPAKASSGVSLLSHTQVAGHILTQDVRLTERQTRQKVRDFSQWFIGIHCDCAIDC